MESQMRTQYDSKITMAEALKQYFQANNFGEDGGYDAEWVDFKMGPIPMPFPNTPARKKAVPFHDMHHIVTGYQTNTLAEFEISAWEIGAGCKDFFAAWQINLGGLTAGILSAPRRTWRAFLRGRSSETLYGNPLPELMQKTVEEARGLAKIRDDEEFKVRPSDVLLFIAAGFGGLVSGVVSFAAMLLALPFLLALSLLRRRRLQAAKI